MARIDQQRNFERSDTELESVFEFVRSVAEEIPFSARDKYAVDCALEELFTNCVKYSNGSGSITVRLTIDGTELRLTLVDRDADDFDPDSAQVPRIEAGIEERSPGGLGLHLVRSLFDRVDYRHDGGDLAVIATKKLQPPVNP